MHCSGACVCEAQVMEPGKTSNAFVENFLEVALLQVADVVCHLFCDRWSTQQLWD